MAGELRGVAAAPGVAVAAPWVHRPPTPDGGPRRTLDEAAAEAVGELETLAGRLRAAGSSEEAGILEAQALMAVDEELLGDARRRTALGAAPSDAVVGAGDAIAAVFEAMEDEVIAARGADVRDVSARIARHVVGAEPPRLERRSIAVAVDLPPSVTVELDRALLAGIALEGGSHTAHAAILARALGIPAVVGVPALLDAAAGAELLGLDGEAGRVIVDPDASVRADLEARAAARARSGSAVVPLANPVQTADGHRVACHANVGNPEEALAAFGSGAEGIGLFRTEFAFAGRRTAPAEDEQAAAYGEVLRLAAGRPAVIRLADIGGDKALPYVPIAHEANPFLGVRAIRLAASHPDLYPTQIRAILRASAATGATAWIMAPMVADVADVELLQGWVGEACSAVPDAPTPRVGIMVEVPSAVMLAGQLAERVDFMSIGTNDLTQYLLAADRTNPALADRQDGLHPALLAAVASVVEQAHRAPTGCAVAVCGELAGDPIGAQLLVGLGVDELSMAPASFEAVGRAIGGRTRDELGELARAALACTSAAAVRELATGR
jgi:phosphoenolpyruvate-protein phosphotransferase